MIIFSVLEVLLSVTSCRRKALNYQRELQISEEAFSFYKMPRVCG